MNILVFSISIYVLSFLNIGIKDKRCSIWKFTSLDIFFPTRMGKDMLRRLNTVTTSFAHQIDQDRQSDVYFRMALANNKN